MFDPSATEVELSTLGRDWTIKQSPGILQSNRDGGTTGAVIWRMSVKFAEWLASPQNALFEHGIFHSNSIILELGSGVSGIVPLTLSPKVKTAIATDQQYILKLLQENITENIPSGHDSSSQRKSSKARSQSNNVKVLPLDWENDDPGSLLRSHGIEDGVDGLLVCDCIFNYALIEPLVQTCVGVCKLRQGEHAARPTICIITQQLRQAEVFEQWLQAFMKDFQVWRIPPSMLSAEMQPDCGFVIHVGLLHQSIRS